jgi:hypothetical protein
MSQSFQCPKASQEHSCLRHRASFSDRTCRHTAPDRCEGKGRAPEARCVCQKATTPATSQHLLNEELHLCGALKTLCLPADRNRATEKRAGGRVQWMRPVCLWTCATTPHELWRWPKEVIHGSGPLVAALPLHVPRLPAGQNSISQGKIWEVLLAAYIFFPSFFLRCICSSSLYTFQRSRLNAHLNFIKPSTLHSKSHLCGLFKLTT